MNAISSSVSFLRNLAGFPAQTCDTFYNFLLLNLSEAKCSVTENDTSELNLKFRQHGYSCIEQHDTQIIKPLLLISTKLKKLYHNCLALKLKTYMSFKQISNTTHLHIIILINDSQSTYLQCYFTQLFFNIGCDLKSLTRLFIL